MILLYVQEFLPILLASRFTKMDKTSRTCSSIFLEVILLWKFRPNPNFSKIRLRIRPKFPDLQPWSTTVPRIVCHPNIAYIYIVYISCNTYFSKFHLEGARTPQYHYRCPPPLHSKIKSFKLLTVFPKEIGSNLTVKS